MDVDRLDFVSEHPQREAYGVPEASLKVWCTRNQPTLRRRDTNGMGRGRLRGPLHGRPPAYPFGYQR